MEAPWEAEKGSPGSVSGVFKPKKKGQKDLRQQAFLRHYISIFGFGGRSFFEIRGDK